MTSALFMSVFHLAEHAGELHFPAVQRDAGDLLDIYVQESARNEEQNVRGNSGAFPSWKRKVSCCWRRVINHQSTTKQIYIYAKHGNGIALTEGTYAKVGSTGKWMHRWCSAAGIHVYNLHTRLPIVPETESHGYVVVVFILRSD